MFWNAKNKMRHWDVSAMVAPIYCAGTSSHRWFFLTANQADICFSYRLLKGLSSSGWRITAWKNEKKDSFSYIVVATFTRCAYYSRNEQEQNCKRTIYFLSSSVISVSDLDLSMQLVDFNL